MKLGSLIRYTAGPPPACGTGVRPHSPRARVRARGETFENQIGFAAMRLR